MKILKKAIGMVLVLIPVMCFCWVIGPDGCKLFFGVTAGVVLVIFGLGLLLEMPK